jgi:3-deoxy-D-manno-octulosonic-acid transferase
VKPLAGALFNQLDALCVQEQADIARWQGLGVQPSKIRLTGSIKFDPATSGPAKSSRDFRPLLTASGIPESAPILLGGSTFEGEEILLAKVAAALHKEFPDLLLILVPRHAERCQKLFLELRNDGHAVVLRSEAPFPSPPEILLVNTTGELRDWYDCATVVFIGKSLTTTKGGQNPAEAIAANKPVLFGPHMLNFLSLARQMREAGGAIEVQTPDELQSEVARLLRDPAKCKQVAAAARDCLQVHTGATQRTVEILQSFS